MNPPYARLPFERIELHRDFIKSHKPALEVYLSSRTLDIYDLPEIASIINKELAGIPGLTLHGPFMDLSPGAVDSAIAEVTLKRFLDIVDVADRVNAKCIVFHSGYEKWKYSKGVEPWLSRSLEFWPKVIARAEKAGVRLAIENIFEEEPGNLKLLMQGLNSKTAGICFDTGHFNLFSRLTLEEWLESIGQYIIEFHLHDNAGDNDSHLPPGAGTFDFPRLLRQTKDQDIIWTIEANSPEETLLSIQRLKEYSQ